MELSGPYSYININTYSCLGLINVSKIKQYVQNQSTSAYHSVDFGDKENPVLAHVTGSANLKKFSIEIRDAKSSQLVQFPVKQYPTFHDKITYYAN